MDDELLAYYDEIRRLAEAKSDSREEAEDLLSETFLAAFAYRHNGGVIEHPKTYLVHTLMHKRNSLLRRKYRLPKVVSLQTLPEDAADDFTAAEEAYERIEEAAALRRTLLYLSETTREVLLRYYFNGSSVADIAEQLGIPAGTVKSRLSAGREAVRKGLTNRMNETKNRIPDRLHLYAGGAMGLRDEPMSLVEGDLIAQNLLIAAYDKPLTITELAAALSVPTVYLEPIVRRLTDGELMRRTDGGRYATDFVLLGRRTTAGASTRSLRSCATLRMLLGRSGGSARGKSTRRRLPRAPLRRRRKLERYVLLRTLQSFQLHYSDEPVVYPKRRDGGSWIAMGRVYPGGCTETDADRKASEYVVHGGHRTSGGACDCGGASYLKLCEFDTTLWDSPRRFAACGYDVYFREMPQLLWRLHKGLPLDGVSNTMLECLDELITVGLLTRENGALQTDVPVLSSAEYAQAEAAVDRARRRLEEVLGRRIGRI
ncbi:MAG: sigma-70 family RNA polymerase sigma factor [Acutalibacteraceae bacterium]